MEENAGASPSEDYIQVRHYKYYVYVLNIVSIYSAINKALKNGFPL